MKVRTLKGMFELDAFDRLEAFENRVKGFRKHVEDIDGVYLFEAERKTDESLLAGNKVVDALYNAVLKGGICVDLRDLEQDPVGGSIAVMCGGS